MNVSGIIKKIVSGLSLMVFSILIINVVAQVIFRYVLKISVPWTEEFARIAMIWMVFFGIALVEADRDQIRTDFFINKLPSLPKRIVETVVGIASIIFMLGLLKGTYTMFTQTHSIMMGALAWVPTSIIYLPAVLGIPLAVWFLVRNLIVYEETIEIKEERK